MTTVAGCMHCHHLVFRGGLPDPWRLAVRDRKAEPGGDLVCPDSPSGVHEPPAQGKGAP